MKICKITINFIIAISFILLFGCGGGGGSSSSSNFSYVDPSLFNNVNNSTATNTEETNNQETNNQETIVDNTVKKKPWLFLVYFAADNSNIVKYQLSNLDYLEKVGSDENTDIVAFIDIGNPKQNVDNWNTSEWASSINWTGARGYYIKKDTQENKINSTVIGEYGKVNSGSGDFLKQCLKEAIINYPAENICLVLDNHGDAYYGVLADESEKTIISNQLVRRVIKEIEEETGCRINILGFDACGMSEIEALYEYRDLTDYILASEEVLYNYGWGYEEILDNSKGIISKNTSEFEILLEATEILQNKYKEQEENLYSKIASDITPKQFVDIIFDVNKNRDNYIKTFAVIDTSKLENLKKSVDNFAKAVISSNLTNKNIIKKYIKLSPNEQEAIVYGISSTNLSGFSTLDLYNMIDTIYLKSNINDENIKTSITDLKSAIRDTVINNSNAGSDYLFSYGISIMYTDSYDTLSSSKKNIYENLEFVKSTKWLDMIKKL